MQTTQLHENKPHRTSAMRAMQLAAQNMAYAKLLIEQLYSETRNSKNNTALLAEIYEQATQAEKNIQRGIDMYTHSIDQAAKKLGVGPRKLVQKLVEKNIFVYDKNLGRNRPKLIHVNEGFFEVDEALVNMGTHHRRVLKINVTGAGMFFLSDFVNEHMQEKKAA